MRLDIAVHDSFGMAEIECFEKFENVETDIEVGKFGIEGFEFGVLNVGSVTPSKKQTGANLHSRIR